MNIQTLLKNTSRTRQETLLATILSAAFETDAGEIDLEKEPPANLGELLANEVGKLVSLAETNLATIAAAGEIPEGSLDDSIHDLFSGQASEINNGGTDAQSQALVVEYGWAAADLDAAAADGSPNARFSEIPEA